MSAFVDVLAIACEFLTDVSDILSFAHTCSTLRPVGIRWMLSMKPAYLRDGASVRRFHSFLFVDPPARTPHVRALDIDYPPRVLRPQKTLPGDSSLLCDILTSCTHLENISIYLEDDSGRCTDDPQVIDTITGIQSLHSLSIHGWSTPAFDLLRGLRTPLRMLNISFENSEIETWFPGALEMFLPRSLVPTLEELQLCSFIVDLDEAQMHPIGTALVEPRPYLDTAPFPALRSLRIRSLESRPLLDRLQHFFPALDGTLALGTLDSDVLDEGTYDGLRAANQRAQEGVQGGLSRSRAWRKLDRLVCDPRMLFVLGLRCPIRLIVLDNCSAQTNRLAAAALGDNPVPRLKLSFGLSEGRDVLDGLFSPMLARVLTHLTLCFIFDNDGGPRSDADPETVEHLLWEDLLNTIVSAVQPLQKLTHLRVVVHSNIHHDPSCPVAYSEEFVRATRPGTFDFAGTAALLARPLPSLQYLFLTASGYLAERDDDSASDRFWKLNERWWTDRAWRIVSPEPVPTGSESGRVGEPVLVGLHGDVAETIMRNEELVLSDVDEAWLHLNDD